jgi:hypothetical protein
VLESSSSIDHAPVKEYPAAKMTCLGKVSDRERDRTPRKGGFIHPRQRTTVAKQLVCDDPPTRFLHRHKPALAEFSEQR